jgi:hypothetical protein
MDFLRSGGPKTNFGRVGTQHFILSYYPGGVIACLMYHFSQLHRVSDAVRNCGDYDPDGPTVIRPSPRRMVQTASITRAKTAMETTSVARPMFSPDF